MVVRSWIRVVVEMVYSVEGVLEVNECSNACAVCCYCRCWLVVLTTFVLTAT